MRLDGMIRTLCLIRAALILTSLNFSLAMSDDKPTVDLDVKMRAIKGQILSKLGMNHPPEVSPSILANIVIPSDLQQVYDVSTELSKRKERQRLEEVRAEESRYYAQRVFTVDAKELQEHPCDTWWNQLFKTSLFFSVDLWELRKLSASDPDFFKVVYAELRLHRTAAPTLPPSLSTTDADYDDGEQLLEVYQLLDCSWTASRKRYLGATRVKKYETGYVGFDITDGIEDLLKNPDMNHGLQLSVHPGEATVYPFKTLFPTTGLEIEFHNDDDDENSTPSPKEREKTAKIVVMFQSNNNGTQPETANRKRKRRADTCASHGTGCCRLQNIYVDFHRDLGFDWILEPAGYYANECAGSCPHLWESDVQHRQIMGLYYTMNPGASVDPCCVARTYHGLEVMYVNETGHVKVKEMPDMSAMICSCR